ncbi:MAG: polyphenol oxidase family protein [Acidimicrobiia bacterium]
MHKPAALGIRGHVDGAGILFGDRTGGVSAPPFDTANAGYCRGDDPEAVAENRRRLGAVLGGPAADPSRWFCLRQHHGAVVVAASRSAVLPPGDASVTTDPDVTLAILTADCGPLALVTRAATGAVHAGWRGVAAGVVEAAVERVAVAGGHTPRAVLGPCVRPCCYEFAPDDLEPLAERFGPGVRARTADGRPALDLPAAIGVALRRAGVVDLVDLGTCTACSPRHFSHRREGRTGLQVMLVTGPHA